MHFLPQAPEKTSHHHECAACGSRELSPYINASASGLKEANNQCTIKFYLCNYCKSINEFSSSQGFYDASEDKAFANFYLDVGAGIEEMIDPIARFAQTSKVAQEKGSSFSFLELGCGFGFVVDYAKTVLGWQSHGIEPGGYGRIGSQALDVRIDHQLLGEGSAADATKYDCIYASEVLEHLADPQRFLHTCHHHLNDNGMLIMTTPAAEYINQLNPPEEVYACLFPGEHKIIFSARGLEIALAHAGFQSFQLERRRDNNWVILASPLQNIQTMHEKNDLTENARQQYHEYLYLSLARHSDKNLTQQRRVKMALCFRLIKYLVNTGDLEKALDMLRQWYGDIASLADAELSDTSSNKAAPSDENNLICSLLSLCLIGLTRERIETELYQRPYPRSGAAFLKTLGFFITIIAHNIETPDKSKVLKHTIIFLESLIDYAIFAKNCKTPFYHLELISLIGPATSSLFLAKKKLGLGLYQNEYPFISQDWFSSAYPASNDEIKILCTSETRNKSIALLGSLVGHAKSSLRTSLSRLGL